MGRLRHRTSKGCTYFVTTKTWENRAIFQAKDIAEILISCLTSYQEKDAFLLHEFVVMPNHLHVLVTVPEEMTVEKAMQLIKGGFSFRAGKELGFHGEIWQRGFSDVRISDDLSFSQHRAYIDGNPVKAGLADAPGRYPYCSTFLKEQKRRKVERKSESAGGEDSDFST